MRWPRQIETNEPSPHQATEHPWCPLAHYFPPTDLTSEVGSRGGRQPHQLGKTSPLIGSWVLSPAGWYRAANSTRGEFPGKMGFPLLFLKDTPVGLRFLESL